MFRLFMHNNDNFIFCGLNRLYAILRTNNIYINVINCHAYHFDRKQHTFTYQIQAIPDKQLEGHATIFCVPKESSKHAQNFQNRPQNINDVK